MRRRLLTAAALVLLAAPAGAHPHGRGALALKPLQGMIRIFRGIAGTREGAARIVLDRCRKSVAGGPYAIVGRDRMPAE